MQKCESNFDVAYLNTRSQRGLSRKILVLVTPAVRGTFMLLELSKL